MFIRAEADPFQPSAQGLLSDYKRHCQLNREWLNLQGSSRRLDSLMWPRSDELNQNFVAVQVVGASGEARQKFYSFLSSCGTFSCSLVSPAKQQAIFFSIVLRVLLVCRAPLNGEYRPFILLFTY